MSIVITGASGSYGRQVTGLLLEKLPAPDLILVTRNPAALAPLAARGVQVRAGDFDKPETLVAALAGAEKMLLISTLAVGPRRQKQHRAAVEAAGKAGVKHIVYTSSVGIHPRSPSLACGDHYVTEELLRRSGVAFTFLRDAQYAEIIATMIAPMAVQMGKLVMSTGSGCMAFVSKKDCVASAAAVLTSAGHEGAAYEITGPELYTFADAAALASELSGKPVEYVGVTPEEKLALFDAAGVPREYVEGMANDDGTGVWGSLEMLSYERAVREHYFSVCSHHVQLLTGRPARTLREVFVANAASLKV
ncbi:MAG TPA: SDR family oxidoreductase [Candidatus Acidoferrales bacterium]|jgi:NAD(P)H dehydrogenase (quinone)|nr:SDR family oxidoreductase [Candidatus Acidoferrales bacterium]